MVTYVLILAASLLAVFILMCAVYGVNAELVEWE